MPSPALIVLIKNPIPGKTKTRLAQDVGDEKALRMYQILLDYTRQEAAQLTDATRYLYYSDHIVEGDEWSASTFTKSVQQGHGLGERMEHAFTRAFADGHDRVIIIGSDCPGVTTALLREALDRLDESDLVLGPALDGGYYLLGMRKLHPSLFREMNWSTTTVAKETRARAQVQGLTVEELTPLSDVDHLEDWLGYGWSIPE
jgi:rSAM/selenodomain-associated transferase 1